MIKERLNSLLSNNFHKLTVNDFYKWRNSNLTLKSLAFPSKTSRKVKHQITHLNLLQSLRENKHNLLDSENYSTIFHKRNEILPSIYKDKEGKDSKHEMVKKMNESKYGSVFSEYFKLE